MPANLSPVPLATALVAAASRVSEPWYRWFVEVRKEIMGIRSIVTEIEHHLHNHERWFGKTAVQTATDWGTTPSTAPYTVVSGNNTWGTEIQVIGSGDTPIQTGKTYFDPHRIFAIASSVSTIWLLRMIYGTGTAADAITANQFTDFPIRIDSANPAQSAGAAFDMMMEHVAAGTQIWMQGWNATNGATLTFLIGVHEYDE